MVVAVLNRALFVVDPGASTGVAWAIVDDEADTVADAMFHRFYSGSATVHEGKIEKAGGLEFQKIIRSQVHEIVNLWESFCDEVMVQINKHGGTIEVVAEHFVLTPSPHHKPGVEGIVPAFLIGALIEALPEEEIIFQTAAKGMRLNNQQKLRGYDAWIVGKEHERAAFAHMAARLFDVLR